MQILSPRQILDDQTSQSDLINDARGEPHCLQSENVVVITDQDYSWSTSLTLATIVSLLTQKSSHSSNSHRKKKPKGLTVQSVRPTCWSTCWTGRNQSLFQKAWTLPLRKISCAFPPAASEAINMVQAMASSGYRLAKPSTVSERLACMRESESKPVGAQGIRSYIHMTQYSHV